MATKTLRFVSDKVRNFSGQYGSMSSFKVQFEDGEEGEVCCKEPNLANTLAKYKELVGKASEFEITDGGKFPSGDPKPCRVKLPQQQAAGGSGGRSWGGGGKAWEPQFKSTAEGVAYEEERSDRRTALMQAVKKLEEVPDGKVLPLADAMYAWLRKSRLPLSAPKPAEPSPVPAAVEPAKPPAVPPPPPPAKPAPVQEPEPVGVGPDEDMPF